MNTTQRKQMLYTETVKGKEGNKINEKTILQCGGSSRDAGCQHREVLQSLEEDE